jgi:hypothetical protein
LGIRALSRLPSQSRESVTAGAETLYLSYGLVQKMRVLLAPHPPLLNYLAFAVTEAIKNIVCGGISVDIGKVAAVKSGTQKPS